MASAKSSDADLMTQISARLLAGKAPVTASRPPANPSPTLASKTPRAMATQSVSSPPKEALLNPQALATQPKKENVAPASFAPIASKNPQPSQDAFFTYTTPKATENAQQSNYTASTTKSPASTSTNSDSVIAQREGGVNASGYAGPRLSGTPEQLAEARAFMNSASRGSTRSRLVSRDPNSSSPSTVGSPRVSPPRVATAYLAAVARPRALAPAPPNAWGVFASKPVRAAPAPTPSASSPATAPFSGFSPLANSPATTVPTPAASQPVIAERPTPMKSSLAAVRTPPTTSPELAKPIKPTTLATPASTSVDPLESMTKSMEKASLVDGKASAPSVKATGGTLGLRQMADITNTLRDRAAELPPPHLRAKGVVKSEPPTASSVPAKTIASPPNAGPSSKVEAILKPSITVATEKVQPTDETTMKQPFQLEPTDTTQSAVRFSPDRKLSGQANKVSQLPTVTNGIPQPVSSVIKDLDKVITEMKAMPKQITVEASGTKQTSIVPDADTSTGEASLAGTKEMMLQLADLQQQLATLTARVNPIVDDYLTMAKDVHGLKEAEERRKFLGTDSAKTPFVIDVSYPTGVTHSVQVSKELRVRDLIRRVRIKGDITSETSQNPRILVRGGQVGHGMTLGELCVMKDDKVIFTYDGADDEEEL